MNTADLKFLRRELLLLKKHYEITKNPRFLEDREQYMIIRGMHSIEKGLSLANPRPGFGVNKVLALIKRIESYNHAGFDCHHPSIQMALGAIKQYVEWNRDHHALNDDVSTCFDHLLETIPFDCSVGGGANHYCKRSLLTFDLDAYKKVVYSRHSIRSFGSDDVPKDTLIDAVEDANRCPSACNRQSTKVHIIMSQDGKAYMADHLEGTGGFAESCNGFILVTGSVSAFDFTENNQWIVSAGIFVGNLVLALHARKVASCVIQRPLVRSKSMLEMRNRFNIPDNEEIICAIGYGFYPEEFSAPDSVRLPAEEIVSFH